MRLYIALFKISRCEYIYILYGNKIFDALENYFSQTILYRKLFHSENRFTRQRKNSHEDPRWIDDELSGHESTGKFPRPRNLTGIRLEILEKGVRVILVESCLPFNGNHREKLRGPRWLRTNVRCVAKERSERMARKKNERRTRKDSRVEWSS